MRDDIQSIFDRVQWLAARGRVPGICVQVESGGERFETAAGLHTVRDEAPMTAETRFPMGCITKSLMALACAELHLSGRIDLQAVVGEYLPELRGATGQPEVSLVHLLSHTAGYVEPQLASPFQELTWDRFVAFFQNREQAFRPGAVWSYTQTGHAIVARVLQRVLGIAALDHLNGQMLQGLGIGPGDIRSRTANLRSCTSFHMFSARARRFEPIKIPSDSGFFRESISDIPLSIAELLVLGRALNDRRLALVDPEAIALARKPMIEIEPQAASAEAELAPQAYGLGVGRYGDFMGLTGSYLGSTCAIRCHPQAAAVIVIAMNAWAPSVRDRILTRLMAVLGGYARPPERAAFRFPPEHWAGDYEGLSLGSGVLSVARLDNGVECVVRRAQGETNIVVAQEEDGLHAIRSGGPASVGFHLDPDSSAGYVRIGTSAYRKVVAH